MQDVPVEAFSSTFKLRAQFSVNEVGDLLAVLHVQSAVPPSSSKQLERRTVFGGVFGFDELNVMPCSAIANCVLTRERLAVVLGQVGHTHK